MSCSQKNSEKYNFREVSLNIFLNKAELKFERKMKAKRSGFDVN